MVALAAVVVPSDVAFFNPDAYRIVVLDQRGCGSSTPHISQARTPGEIATNTTWKLVEDLETIRELLGIERWQVFGGSWGSCLSLAYAETHPDRVTELVLRGIFTLREQELDWYYNFGASEVFPELWDKFCEPLRRAGYDFSRDNIAAYYDLLWDDNPGVHGPAAVAWTTWEGATTSLSFDPSHVEEFSDPNFALAFARIENHYFVNHGFMVEGQLLRNAHKLADIPMVIVQGRYDMICPPWTAQRLHDAWPGSRLRMVAAAGHALSEPGITAELVSIMDSLRDEAVAV